MTRLTPLWLSFLVLTGCEKGLGEACDQPSDCRKGLACIGDGEKTCQICGRSTGCKETGLCEPFEGTCIAKPKPRYDNKEGGCPCSCDHSQELASELEALGGEEALERIDDTLAIIAEREDAGFVTEAMVSHRLRLLDLAAKLGMPSFFDHTLWSRNADRAQRGGLLPVDGDGLRVRSELVVHGEKTETIRGKPKLQRACFRLWLEVENTSDEPRVLQVPALQANVPLPVSRWYIEDSEGREWSGALAAREKASVLVIGYVGEPIPPGAEIQATIELESLEIPVTTRARNRWYEAWGEL